MGGDGAERGREEPNQSDAMLERECSRVARSYLYHMCENLGKYQQFLVDFEEKCGLALQKCVKYDAVSTQMGQLTMTDISHNWHTNAGALASDFPEIDQLPDHPDRQVLFVDDRLRRKANGTKAGESASIYGAATAEYYAKLRRAYARRLRLMDNGDVTDVGAKYASPNPSARRAQAVQLIKTPTNQVALDAVERAYLRLGKQSPAGKDQPNTRLIQQMATLGTSEEARMVRRRGRGRSGDAPVGGPAVDETVVADEIEGIGPVIGGREVATLQAQRLTHLSALVDGGKTRALKNAGRRGRGGTGAKTNGVGDWSAGGVASPLATRRDVGEEVFRQALHVFEQRVFDSSGRTLEDALVPRRPVKQTPKFETAVRADGSTFKHTFGNQHSALASLPSRRKPRKTKERKLRDRGLRSMARLDISLSESEDSRTGAEAPMCGVVGKSLVLDDVAQRSGRRRRSGLGNDRKYINVQDACKTGTSAKATRKDARRQKRRLSLARERDFFLQPPEMPDE